MIREVGAAWAAAALLCASGCGLLAPLDDLNRAEPDAGDADRDAEGGENCRERALRCSGTTPQECLEGQWRAAGEDCEFVCEQAECIGECAPKDRQCKNGAARVCDARGEWQTEVCPGTCVQGKCETACEAGSKQCAADEQLEECVDGKFVPIEACEAACVDDACTGECKPNSRRCSESNGNQPERCDARGEWELQATCSEQQPSCVDGQCVACEPKSRTCIDGIPHECNAVGAWSEQGVCGDQTPACMDGICVACLPNEQRCTGNVLEACTADGSAWDVEEQCQGESPVCIPSLKTCGSCLEGDRDCADRETPQVCNDQGEWLVEAACMEPTATCLGAGQCGACDPNETPTRCQDDATVQNCTGDGQWGTSTPCTDPAPICRQDTGRCGCSEGNARCTSNTGRELCVGGNWVPHTACGGVSPFCLPTNGACVACSPGEETCTLGSAERCDEAGSYQPLNACAGATVNCGGCDLGEPCSEDDQCLSANCVRSQCAVQENCANGVDDDADGDADCADSDCTSVSCVDVPSGFLGPVVVATDEFAALPGECPAPFGTERLSLNAEPAAEAATCAACSCTDELSCDGAVLSSFATCEDPPPPSDQKIAAGECASLGGAPPPRGIALLATPGSCGVTGGGEVLATPNFSWDLELRACGQAGGAATGCVAQQKCMPKTLPADFESRYCVYRAGDETCPTGYLNKRVFYNEVEDSRDCSACACETQGDCTTDAWQAFSADNCDGTENASIDACDPASGPCVCGSPPVLSQSIRYAPSLTCEASGGEPTGGVVGKADSATTVCCSN